MSHVLRWCIHLVLLVTLLLFPSVVCYAQNNTSQDTILQQTIPLVTKAMLDNDPISFNKYPWKFLPTSDTVHKADYLSLLYNDSAWTPLPSSNFNLNTFTGTWSGSGWFRLLIRIDTALHNHSLGFSVDHRGASEIYLDGKLIDRYGIVSPDESIESTYRPLSDYTFFTIPLDQHTLRLPGSLQYDSLSGSVLHCIAIRYSDTQGQARANMEIIGRSFVGVGMSIWYAERWYALTKAQADWVNIRILMTACLFALAFLHLVIFLNAGGRHHIDYVVFAFCVGFYFFSQLIIQEYMHTGNLSNLWLSFARTCSLPVAFIFCIALFYRLLYTSFPKKLMLFWGCIPFPLMFGIFFNDFLGSYGLYLLMALVFAEIVRIVTLAIFRKHPNAWVLGIGGIIFVTAIGVQILSQLQIFLLTNDISFVLIPAGFLSIPVSMSVYLSRTMAQTNRSLAEQLSAVQSLTEKTIQQEVERQVLTADNARKTLELEQARALQISMLPRAMPVIQGLDIAMFMQTSTEVGGDYYDYFVSANQQSITIAIGDATGHGVKAGTMVAATKSILSMMMEHSSPKEMLEQSSPALKRMNMRGMFMALQILTITNRTCTIANAGMPSALLYRSAENTMTEIIQKAMPLGAMSGIHYTEQTLTLDKGDALILMSDGFPERFNPQGDIFGYDEVLAFCSQIRYHSAQDIIEQCLQKSEAWAQGAPLNDDMTFVVVRVV